jgi:hypothetical protein
MKKIKDLRLLEFEPVPGLFKRADSALLKDVNPRKGQAYPHRQSEKKSAPHPG